MSQQQQLAQAVAAQRTAAERLLEVLANSALSTEAAESQQITDARTSYSSAAATTQQLLADIEREV